jgi:chromosomal replication initiation ATPase DnaA
MNPYIKAGIVRLQKTTKNEILKVVAEQFHLDPATVVSKKRHRPIPDAKSMYCLIARKVLKMETLKGIGETIHVDHSNVVHHLKKGADLLDTDYHYHRRYISALDKLKFSPTTHEDLGREHIGYYYDKPGELERWR